MKTQKISTPIILIIAICLLLTSSNVKASDDDSDFVLTHDLNDSNFESSVNNGTKNPWLIIFYVDSCPHCKNAKQTLNSLANSPDSIAKSRIKLGLVDCDANMFTCYRFKISRVPYIVILDSNHIYELNEYPSKDNLERFINLKKNADEGLEIPTVVGYLEFFYKSLEELVKLMDKTIEGYLNNNLGVKIEWRSEYTIGLLALALVLIVVVEYAILSLICKTPGSKSKKTAVKEKKEESEEVKENVSDKTQDAGAEEGNNQPEKTDHDKKDD